MTPNYTAQDWAEHEQFVQKFRAAKQRKREWQQKMEVVLAEKAEKQQRKVCFDTYKAYLSASLLPSHQGRVVKLLISEG